MSVVTVQLGQCGNQIGGDFFRTVMNDVNSSCQHKSDHYNQAFKQAALERFFNKSTNKSDGSECWVARAVMVDMEQKVIAQMLQEAKKSGTWKYPDKQQFCQKRGSGNNWAHGFCTHGPKSKDAVMNMVRKEVEKCDHFGGFLTLMSLAGGTGSGVGAYVTQCLRDEYPHSFCLNQVVLPYRMGEVIVQNYNAVLTLSHLYQSADAVLTLDNDNLHEICLRLLAIKSVSFQDINSVISHKMASIFLPVYQGLNKDDWENPIRNHMGSMLEHLVPHPDYKLLTLQNIPQMSQKALQYSTYQWPGLLKHLRQMLIAKASFEEGINWQIRPSSGGRDFNKSLSSLLVVRGKDINQCDVSSFRESKLFVPWAPGELLQTWGFPREFNQYEKSAALLSNSQSVVENLDQVVDRAWRMYASRAYVHQYVKHGITEEDFVDSFAMLEQVVSNYKNLS